MSLIFSDSTCWTFLQAGAAQVSCSPVLVSTVGRLVRGKGGGSFQSLPCVSPLYLKPLLFLECIFDIIAMAVLFLSTLT